MKQSAYVFIFLLGMILVLGFGNKLDTEKVYKLNPAPDMRLPTQFYIPQNLDDCFQELNKMLPSELIWKIKKGAERDMIQFHLNLGMWIRNNWGLWRGSRLSEYFNGIGIKHPDDMSSIILNSYWRYLHHKPINLKEQADLYKSYWSIIKKHSSKDKTQKKWSPKL